MRNWELYLCELLNPKTLTFGDLVSHVESDLDVIQVPEASLLRILGSIYPRIKANRKSRDFGIPTVKTPQPPKPLPSGIWFPMLSPALT